MSKTPRTDKEMESINIECDDSCCSIYVYKNNEHYSGELVTEDFARELELELNTAKTFLSFACDRLAILARTNNDYILVDRIKRIVQDT